MTFNINWYKKGVYIKFRGVVTSQDLIDTNNYIISNGKFDSIDYQIFDFLDIDDFKITPYDITIIGTMNKSQSEFKENMKIAIITNDDYIQNIIQEYEGLMKGSKWLTKNFPDVESANKWVRSK
jgi:hypothetical protein